MAMSFQSRWLQFLQRVGQDGGFNVEEGLKQVLEGCDSASDPFALLYHPEHDRDQYMMLTQMGFEIDAVNHKVGLAANNLLKKNKLEKISPIYCVHLYRLAEVFHQGPTCVTMDTIATIIAGKSEERHRRGFRGGNGGGTYFLAV